MLAVKRTRGSKSKSSATAQPRVDDDVFGTTFDLPSDSDQDSEYSEYGSKRKSKPKRRKTHHKSGPVPKAPEVSYDEYEDHQGTSLALADIPKANSTNMVESHA